MTEATTSAITTHVLNTAAGSPAAGIVVHLDAAGESGWRRLADGVTDADGRARSLGPARAPAGQYRLIFETGRYFAEREETGFFPEITVTFTITDPAAHHHVPVLLSPFAYSTYRGS